MAHSINHFKAILLKISIFVCFFSISSLSFSQTRTIQGVISDINTGEKLSRTSIYVIENKQGNYSDDQGNFQINIPLYGNSTIRFSYVGYENKEITIKETTSSPLIIQMKPNNNLGEVIISTRKKDENITKLSMGVEKLSIEQIKAMPALLGEVDVIKSIQLLPGIQATSEGGSGFSVRGGSPDQNLIVLDNTTVYNPSHLMGFFSIFNNDVISGIELYKGDFPFKFGGRLSSLLEVQTKNEIPDKFRGTGGIGLISSRIMLEGPIKEKTSWMVGGRRSYADLFLKLSSDKDIRNTTMYFYDLNGKLSHQFSEKDKIELNGYYGLDNFGAQPGSFKYGNSAASLTWNHVFSNNLFGKYSLHFSNYDYGLTSKLEGSRMEWKSSITDWTFRADMHQPINQLWDISYGTNLTYHKFNPGWVKMEGMDKYSVPGNEALEYATYLSNDQSLFSKLNLRYGVRLSIFQNIGNIKHTYMAIEPGLGMVYLLNKQSSIKANYTRNTQYIQLANNSASGSPLDVWFSASPNIKPQKVDMFSIGYFHNFEENMYEASIEIYYKNLKNVIDFKEHANLILNENLEEEVRTGKGKAYGIELMAKKNFGRITGFINYTISRSERTISEINQGKTYLAPFDKTHAINIVATYNFSKKLNFSAIWVFATGNPTTYPTGRFEIDGEYFPIYSGRNEYRKPNYDRLDLSVNYTPNPDSKRRWKGEWNFSIYNAYNRKNPWTITYKQDRTSEAPYAEMLYLFGIVPSVTYNIKF